MRPNLLSTTVADREPAFHLGNARLLEWGYLNMPADATLLYRQSQVQTATVVLERLTKLVYIGVESSGLCHG